MQSIDDAARITDVAALGLLRRWEGRLLFGQPRHLRAAPLGPQSGHVCRPVRLRVAPACEVAGVVTQPADDAPPADDAAAPAILVWFGGRNEDVRWTTTLASWLGAGDSVAAFAYRGHGGSDGWPDERVTVEDGLCIVGWLLQQVPFARSRLLLAGRSLGSSVAVQVAARLPDSIAPAGLILLSPMDSIRSMVRARPFLAPLAWCMRNSFDSLAVAGSIDCPALILLAEQDRRVSHARSLRLADALGCGSPTGVQTIPATDHRTLPRSPGALAAIQAFAAGLPRRR